MRIETVPIDDIIPDNDQPRKHFNEKKLEKLKDSIIGVGVSESIEVRCDNGKYVIISGERRFRAVQKILADDKIDAETKAKFENLEVMIFEGEEYKQKALFANLFREDLTLVDHAETVARYKKDKNITNEELGKEIGKSDATVGVYIQVSDLPKKILDDARSRDSLSLWILEEVAKKGDEEEKISLWNHLKDGKTSREEYRKQNNSDEKKKLKFNYSSSIKKMQRSWTDITNLNEMEITFKDKNEKEELQAIVKKLRGEVIKISEKIKNLKPDTEKQGISAENIEGATIPAETHSAVVQEQTELATNTQENSLNIQEDTTTESSIDINLHENT